MNAFPGTLRAHSTFLVDVEINNKKTTNNTKYIWKEGAIYHILQHDVAYNTLRIITSFIPVKRNKPLQRNNYLYHTFYLESCWEEVNVQRDDDEVCLVLKKPRLVGFL